MITKFRTAAEYDTDHTKDCEIALVVLLQAFATLKSTVRLIGGLVPRYLIKANPPDVPVHTGTTDVDVVLNISVLAEKGTYAKLKDQLKTAGFTQFVTEGGKVSTWQWAFSETGKTIVVEFLQHTDETEPERRLAAIDDEGVTACKILHAGIAHTWFKEIDITVDLPNKNGKSQETIRFADEVAFIVLKALAFDSRNTNKDAGDLIYVLRHGQPKTIAETYSRRLLDGQHTQALEDGLQALVKRFCDDEHVEGFEKDGPSKYALFHGLGDTPDDERIRVMRETSDLVTYFVKEVEKCTGKKYLPEPAQPQTSSDS